MTQDQVRAYYAVFGEREWARLNGAEGSVEFAVHCKVISDHLPPGARVLDIGGGPGRYTIWLAQHGHRVTLADLSPDLLAIAQSHVAEAGLASQVEEIVEADACDLSRWPAASFDAALCLGPFYHLPDLVGRERAAAELCRVLTPGGLAFVALMPRLAFLRRTLAIADERRHLADPDFVARLLDEGQFVNDVLGRFNGGYGVRPEEVIPFFERNGFGTVTLLASEGILSGIEGVWAELSDGDPDVVMAAMELLMRTATEPSILGMSSHLLYVGRSVV